MNMFRQLFGPAPSAPNVASPAPQAAAQSGALSPNSLAEMTRLIGGDLSGLSTGDKLMALSGLLRSATRSGRRAGLTPEQAIQAPIQQRFQQLQNQVALEQLVRDRSDRKARQEASEAFAERITDPALKRTYLSLPLDERVQIAASAFGSTNEPTAFMRTHEFIKQTYGPKMAEAFTLNQTPSVSVDLPGFQQYQGPLLGAPEAVMQGSPAPALGTRYNLPDGRVAEYRLGPNGKPGYFYIEKEGR